MKQHVLAQPGCLDLEQEALEEIFWPVFNQMNWNKGMKKSVSSSVGTDGKFLILVERKETKRKEKRKESPEK